MNLKWNDVNNLIDKQIFIITALHSRVLYVDYFLLTN